MPSTRSQIDFLLSLQQTWLQATSDETRGLLRFLIGTDVLSRVLDGKRVVDLRAAGADGGSSPLLPNALPIEFALASAESLTMVMENISHEQDGIVLRDALEYVDDYRGVLAACFARLAMGGMLVVVVPHQFLFERKIQAPSRFVTGHRRFYTAANLIAEIEEAIDPSEFRLRFLGDHDRDYGCDPELTQRPQGAYQVVACLERCEKPVWRDQLTLEEMPVVERVESTRILPPDAFAPAYRLIAPDPSGIERIVVLKLDHRGDYIMADLAFRILREAFPAAHITLVCGSWNAGSGKSCGLFDEVIPFDYFAEDVSSTIVHPPHEQLASELMTRLAGQQFDLGVDLRFFDETRDLLHRISARHKAGFESYNDFPWLDIPLTLPAPTRDGRAETRLIPAARFHHALGGGLASELCFSAGFQAEHRVDLVWGPYEDMPVGTIDLEILVEPLNDEVVLGFDMVHNAGRDLITAGVLRARLGTYPTLSINLPHRIREFELRLHNPDSTPVRPFRFMGMRWTRPGALVGVHQREGMALLAHLVAIRLKNPVSEDVFT